MKKESFYLLSFLLIIPLVFFSSCSDDEDEPILAPLLESVTFSSEETVKTFTLQSNVGWVISSDDTWCSVSPEYGSGTQEITITLKSKNEDTSNKRTATLTIKSGQTVSKIIQITQSAAPKENEGDEDGDGEEEEEPLSAKEIIFDTVNTELNNKYGVWLYFSFEKEDIVGMDIGSLENDAKWKERTDWDIAFTRFYTRTNSGESGNGLGGVIEIEAPQGNTDAFKNLTIAPTEEYISDTIVEGMMINMPPFGGNIYNSGGNVTLNSWLDNAENPPVAHPKVFAVKTADGKYAKIFMKEYDSGIITMQYVYQPDGSTNLATEKE